MSTLPKLTKNIAEMQFGALTAIEYSRSKNGAIWLFSCQCGLKKEIKSSLVTKGYVKSCGCLSKSSRFSGSSINEGEKFGNITAVRMEGRKGHNISWECRCNCGKSFSALVSNIISGNTKSCGCHRRKVSSDNARKHGMSTTKAYGLWKNMMRRCYDSKNPAYENYGGRGIHVSAEWHSFETFFSDMGERPKDRSIERRNNDIGYSKENCYWATRKQQANNTRVNVLLSIDGVEKTISQWSEEFGVPASRAIARRKIGWSDHELFLPLRPRRNQWNG